MNWQPAQELYDALDESGVDLQVEAWRDWAGRPQFRVTLVDHDDVEPVAWATEVHPTLQEACAQAMAMLEEYNGAPEGWTALLEDGYRRARMGTGR